MDIMDAPSGYGAQARPIWRSGYPRLAVKVRVVRCEWRVMRANHLEATFCSVRHPFTQDGDAFTNMDRPL
jgi:hypothetical protein